MSLVYIWRHRKENLKKCTLRALEGREDLRFVQYPKSLPSFSEAIVLSIEGETLTEKDAHLPLILIDGSWRYAQKMEQHPSLGQFQKRSLPSHYRTAYPRRQDDCLDPSRGLASVEALYLSYLLTGREVKGLLDAYYWKEAFLLNNSLESL